MAIQAIHKISIHALLAESDPMSLELACAIIAFLSTLSLRRATCGRRVGLPVAGHFYPRSPCGERPQKRHIQKRPKKFLSTLSLRRATIAQLASLKLFGYFYPRSPCGERHSDGISWHIHGLFLSTLSLRRATQQRIE